jgi:glycosyltransferase involved in cell wall biosynthesis
VPWPKMRVLHIVKTSDGARWAALQAQVLTHLGIQVHVALPSPVGDAVRLWREAGATIHIVDCALWVNRPWEFRPRAQSIRQLVASVQPDLIHSHFVTTTLMLRLSLGHDYPIPRLFQVPGPLHMEHAFYRNAEITTAGKNDYWIASSQYTRNLYLLSNIPARRVFLSYYGMDINQFTVNSTSSLRKRLAITDDDIVIGNINYMYPPKYYLGHWRGLKRHEDVIDALGIVCRNRPDVVGVFLGGQWGSGKTYEQRLQKRAARAAGVRILFAGRVSSTNVASLWSDFDIAVHVPISENCGGVVEPLAKGVPTIASCVGGLPEVVLEGLTGRLVPPDNPGVLAQVILETLDNLSVARQRALVGSLLVRKMFDVNRTGKEIAEIYQSVLNNSYPPPTAFDSRTFVADLQYGQCMRSD